MSIGMQAIADELRESGNAASEINDGAADEDANSVGTEGAEYTEDEGASEESESTRKPGVDEVLRVLEEAGHGPEYAEVVRDYQRTYSRLNNERNEIDRMRQELREGLEELGEMREEVDASAPPPEEEDAELSKIPSEQQALLQRWLKANGYVSQEELSARENQRMIQDLTQGSNKQGVETWGEEFGHFDGDGKFLVNPEARDKMAPVFDRLVNQKALTFEDMYVLSNFEELISQAKEAGVREARNAVNTRDMATSTRVNNARVAGRSATGATAPVVYDPDNESGDIGAVFRRLRNLAAS